MTDIYRTKVNSAIEKVNDFTSNWDSGGLTANQKSSIENIYSHYKDRSLPPNPYLINFIHMITLAGSNELIQLNIMDEILEVTSKVIENESRNRIHKYSEIAAYSWLKLVSGDEKYLEFAYKKYFNPNALQKKLAIYYRIIEPKYMKYGS